MKTVKTALINIQHCKFPDGINTIDEFAAFLNDHYNSFVELECFVEEGCVEPFFIEEDLKTETRYWNTSSIRYVQNSEIYVLTRSEYQEKLEKVVKEKCAHCVHCSEDVCDEDFKSFIEHIDLNGKCYSFEKKK